MVDYYSVLGVNKGASSDEIRRAYHRLAQQYHPDKPGGDAAKMQRLNEAYDALKHPERRTTEPPQWNPRRPSAHEFDPFSTFSFHASDSFVDLNEFIRTFQARHQVRNNDLTVNYNLGLEDAYLGVAANIRFNTPDGTLRDVMVEIPPGVDNGFKLRVERAGDHSRRELPPGDLYIVIVTTPHPVFRRVGQNLFCEASVDVIEAMLGTTIEVPLIEGGKLKVNVPASSQPGDTLRIPQKGMTTLGTEVRGDLYVNLRLVVPRNLTEAHRKKLSELQELRARPEPGAP